MVTSLGYPTSAYIKKIFWRLFMKYKIRINNFIFITLLSIIILIVIIGVKTNFFTSYNEIIIVIISGLAINILSQYIYFYIVEKRQSDNDVPTHEVQSYIKKFSTYLNLKSSLSKNRKVEIIKLLTAIFLQFVILRKKHLAVMHKKLEHTLKESRSDYLEKSAWSSISVTNSQNKYRFVMGFKNSGCEYWQSEAFNIGCYNCGYCSAILPNLNPTRKELELQFENALGEALQSRVDFDVVEFLNDGSFFNDKEISPDFRKYLFKKINSLKYVKRILVETRPNFIKREEIVSLLSELSSEKTIEIGIGLETSDDFIRTVCINKGYNLPEFEEAVKCLSEFSNRITVVVYALVKPAFLHEKEAISDILNTSKYIESVKKKFNIDIILKLEPAVVAQGTLLDLLFFESNSNYKYEPLSYWSIVEILCKLFTENIDIQTRIGAREDMDIIEKVPGVYDANGMFNKWDFIIYDAVQSFNCHNSIPELLAEIDDAFSDTSYQLWKEKLGNGQLSIEFCRKSLINDINEIKNKSYYQDRRNFLMKVFSALDRIEYGAESISFVQNLSKVKNKIESEKLLSEINKFVEKQFRQVLTDIWVKVIEVNFERDKLKLLRLFLQVRDLRHRELIYTMWAGIPTIKLSKN
ncbi:MAG: hypothetical protein GY795_28655 [Desulfobacterales bacterium]|nr:hypothetical protein [Desulfobacterales bacterium]